MTIDSKDWARIEAHIDSAIETGINRGLAEAHHSCPTTRYNEQQLRVMIIGDSHGKYTQSAGQQFLLALLASKGVQGLDRFMQKATASLLDDGKLELADFDMHERQLLNASKPNLTRRFLLTRGALALGVGAVGKNVVLGLNAQINPHEAEVPKAPLNKAVHLASGGVEAIGPVVEVGIASVVIASAANEIYNERLKQVTDAITQLARDCRTNANYQVRS